MDNEYEDEPYEAPIATSEQVEEARAMIGYNDDINIDEGARISIVEPDEDGLGGGYWIQAWVLVPTGTDG